MSTARRSSGTAVRGSHASRMNRTMATMPTARDSVGKYVRSETGSWHWHEVCGDGQRGLCEMGDAPEDGADDGSRIVVPHGVKDFG